MSRSSLLFIPLSLALLSVPAQAEDICAGGPKETWLKPEAFSKIVAEMGYGEFVLAFEDGCFEAKIVDAEGNHIEIYMDPVTGEVAKIKNEGKS